jgi:hypothetical protein
MLSVTIFIFCSSVASLNTKIVLSTYELVFNCFKLNLVAFLIGGLLDVGFDCTEVPSNAEDIHDFMICLNLF